ncbi:MAG: MBL fold metallo-hydrolase, partial [Bacteroidales bacterium]|nr:MBL fold metallo-hydrolase [Bacteroidales bacterium]
MKKFVLLAIAASFQCALMAQPQPKYAEKVVYEDSNVIFRQIDEQTWEGNGHLMANESLYLIAGTESAILIDAGTNIPGLHKIVSDICKKPVRLIATHVHPDHTGSAINEWDEISINAADEVNRPMFMVGYQGKTTYLTDGEVIDLGGRQIEVIFTPGHTPGSTTFIDKARHYGFSGDSFGSGNLLITVNFSTIILSAQRMAYYMEKNGIEYLYPGHYMGVNKETLQRVKDIAELCSQLREGEKEGEKLDRPGIGGLDHVLFERGVRLNYG